MLRGRQSFSVLLHTLKKHESGMFMFAPCDTVDRGRDEQYNMNGASTPFPSQTQLLELLVLPSWPSCRYLHTEGNCAAISTAVQVGQKADIEVYENRPELRSSNPKPCV